MWNSTGAQPCRRKARAGPAKLQVLDHFKGVQAVNESGRTDIASFFARPWP